MFHFTTIPDPVQTLSDQVTGLSDSGVVIGEYKVTGLFSESFSYSILSSALATFAGGRVSIASDTTRKNLLANCWPDRQAVRKTVAG